MARALDHGRLTRQTPRRIDARAQRCDTLLLSASRGERIVRIQRGRTLEVDLRHGPVAKVDFQRSPSLDPYYPLSARRAEQQGVATLRSCVDAAGRLSGEPAVIESSGHRSLDDGAVSWARAARYSPAVESGRRVDSCATFRVRFVLQD